MSESLTMPSTLSKRAGRGSILAAPLVAAFCCGLGFAAAAHAQEVGSDSGKPVPRFESLRFDEVNMRAGAGRTFPINTIFKRKGLPVEILREFKSWRQVRDQELEIGWIDGSQLTSARTALVLSEKPVDLHRFADGTSPKLARLEPKLVVELLECGGRWCRVAAGGYTGWVSRLKIWGIGESEMLEAQ